MDQNKNFFRTVKTSKTNIDMAKLLCKKRGQKVAKQASGIFTAQTEKFPSTTLKRDQKYAPLQYMADLKSVYKHDRNVMLNKAQNGAIT